MKIFKEEDILDEKFRMEVIKEIDGTENTARKRESYKRWEIYKDRVKKYVIHSLRQELEPETIVEMEPRTSAINITKKIISKKGRVYKTNPARRTVEEMNQAELDELVNLLDLNIVMKKTNRYVELFKNCMVYIQPIQDPSTEDWYIRLTVLPPHLYDVIEDSQCPEKERVVILSHFTNQNVYVSQSPNQRDVGRLETNFRNGDNRNQTIADSPADMGVDNKEYTFWSGQYHFTTNGKGQIKHEKSPEDLLNPIKEMPFVSFNKDQDGAYWALGGEDLIESTLLINMTLTDLYFAAKLHGSGIFYYFGKNAPKSIRLGPNHAITGELGVDDPTPSIGFTSNTLLIDQILRMVEQHIALLLSTNDLGTNSIQGRLDTSTAASGVHELIQNSEPLASIEDEQELFSDREPLIIRKAIKWINVYKDENRLDESFAKKLVEYKGSEELDYFIKYGAAQQFFSEKEKLEVIKQRKELGIDRMIDLIMIDNPDMDKEEATKKLLEISQEKIERQLRMLRNATGEAQDSIPPRPEQGSGESEGQDSTQESDS